MLSSTRARVILVLVFLTGCTVEPPEGAEVHHVALGAVVTLHIDGICRGSLDSICAPEVSTEIVDAQIVDGDAFALVDAGGVDAVTVRADKLGYSRLRVHYLDWSGEEVEVDAWLHAAEITDTLLSLRCDDGVPHDADGLAVAAGTTFSFEAQAVAGELWLLSGELPLVTADGFTLEGTMATAPSTPGEHSWTLAGGRAIRIVVYDPSELRLNVVDRESIGRTIVEVLRMVGDASACVHGRAERAELRVSAGSCRPLLETGVEVEGALPLNVAHGDFELAFVGDGACTVETVIDGGPVVSHSFTVVPEERDPGPTTSGTPLGAGTVSIFGQLPPAGECTLGGTDGDCDYLREMGLIPHDFDCYVDSRWGIGHTDGTTFDEEASVIDETSLVGVGLTTELRLEVRAALFGILDVIEFGPPHDLAWSSAPSGGLSFETIGCRPDTSYEVFRVEALAAGRHEFTFTASNLADVGSYAFEARTVERALYDFGGETDADVFVFTASELDASVAYSLADGTPLRGIAPLLVAGDSPAAGSQVSDSGAIYTGTLAHTIALSSPPAPNAQSAHVVDLSALAAISGVSDTTIAAGDMNCTALQPSTSAGAHIVGTAPERPRVRFSGTALTANFPPRFLNPVLLPPSNANACPEPCLCVQGFAAGSSSTAVQWGTAAASRTIVVTE